MANLVKPGGKERTTISYARYLMAVKLGRILERTEHVDHIDGDKTNDAIDNLQVLTQGDNNRKYVVESGKSTKLVELICPECGRVFYRPPTQVNHKLNKGKKIKCSRECVYNSLRGQ